MKSEDKAGLYLTVIVHLAVVIVLLIVGIDVSLRKENSFILDFTRQEELEKLQEEEENLRKELAFKQSISEKLDEKLGAAPVIRNIAVNRADLKDDRGTDAKQLYEDAARLQKELNAGFSAPDDVQTPELKPESRKNEKKEQYSGPSVISYFLEGRKASKLPIPAYRCYGAGEVTVLITVNNAGTVTSAKVDESCSTPDACLRSFAVRAARNSKFSSSASAPASQSGNIVYGFVAQ